MYLGAPEAFGSCRVPNYPLGNKRFILFESTKFYAIEIIAP